MTDVYLSLQGPVVVPPPPPPDLSSGPTYVRWGRWDCPSSSTLVYKGQAGGSYYGHSGSGTL